MRLIKKYLAAAAAVVLALGATSCKDSKSYAQLLEIETKAVNQFLADQRVDNTIPTDTNFVFETGENAPYYRLDEDGNLYMKVLKYGTRGNWAKDDEIVFFRFTRCNLEEYKNGELPKGSGNETDMSYMNSWFRLNNYTLESSYQWGAGVQTPLQFLPMDCEVNLVVKSQYGFYSETSYVLPFLYTLRYYRQKT